MPDVQFLVQGSAPEPYVVTMQLAEGRFAAFCTCPAGQFGTYCKHRFALLSGDTSGIVSENVADVDLVRGWFRGSPLEAALQDVLEAERQVSAAKRRLSAAKKRVAAAMMGDT